MPEHRSADRSVLMIVGNDVTNDARVKKSAISVARMGFRVTLLAVSPSGSRRESRMGPVRIIRVPLDLTVRDARVLEERARAERRERWRRLVEVLSPRGSQQPQSLRQVRARFDARKRDVEVEIARHKSRIATLTSGPRRGLARVAAGLERRFRWWRIGRLRRQVEDERASYEAVRERASSSDGSGGRTALSWRERRAGWRELVPELLDFERAYVPVIEEVDPDIIHAHDFPMIGIAVRSATIARAREKDVRVIYDAHEFTAGVALPDPRREHGYLDLESEYIHEADAVTTVSQPIAERIAAHHGLERVPDVVMNVPLARTLDRSGGATVREVVGLPDDVPLVVYSGNTSPLRRVELLVAAMAWVPDAHLVVVCNDREERLESLRSLATEVGAAGRFHTAPYAPPDQVSHYLSAADVGVHPLTTDHLNHQLALPNKLFEYLHAGLPVVVADNETMARFVRQHGLGVVFEGNGARDLADKIREVLDAPERFALGREADDLRARHTWEGQEPRLCEVYARVTGRRVHIERDVAFTLEEEQVDAPSRLVLMRPGRDLATSSPRVAIGPANLAGQGWEWARSLEEVNEHAAVEVFELERRYRFPADRRISNDEWRDLDWQLQFARHVLTTYTHVLMEAGLPLLGRLNGATFDCDVPSLRAHGLGVGVVLHGSEVRDPRTHRELERYSPFGIGTDPWIRRLQDRVDDLLPRLERFEGTKFVSTAGLLDHVPDGQWLPVVVDRRIWAPVREVLAHEGRPVVAYAPTSRRLKGGDRMLRVCRDLEQAGLITFVPMFGIPYDDMPEFVQGADILIDGLLLGDYGVTACQAMASGRVVVGNVSRRVRERIPGEVPIVQADPESLRDVLAELVRDPDRLRSVARQGPEYVARFHDGSYAGKALAEWAENAV